MACQCYAAVTRTYRDLKESGVDEDRAFAAAARVYRFHHPERARLDALDIVGGWLDRLETDPVVRPDPH